MTDADLIGGQSWKCSWPQSISATYGSNDQPYDPSAEYETRSAS